MAPDLKPLFLSRDEVMVCLHCDAPMEIDPANCKPGEIHYKPCQCGQTGIRLQGDLYQEIHRKKSFREAYEHSKTRGGRLP